MKFKVIHFNPYNTTKAEQLIHKQYYEGWELISVSGYYYYFRSIK